MRRKNLWFLAVVALALVASACSSDGSGDDTTTTAPSPDTTQATTTTTRAPDPGFEGKVLDSGGCDYGGRVNTITAVDEFTVEFALCGPHPAFLAQIAFGVFGTTM